MYNEVDNDMQPFNSIEGEEIFLFSGAKNPTIGSTYLREDDDEHLRRQSNVASSSSPHLQVDVDELLLSTNYIEPTVSDQHEDSLFWNCKDVLEDHLNEILHNAQLTSNNNNNGNSNNIFNGNNNNQHLSNGVNQFSPNLQQQLLAPAPQIVNVPPNNVLHNHHPQVHTQPEFHHHEHIQQIHAPMRIQARPELLPHQQQLHIHQQQLGHIQTIGEFQSQIDHHQPLQHQHPVKIVPVVNPTAFIEPSIDTTTSAPTNHQNFQTNPSILDLNRQIAKSIDKIEGAQSGNFAPEQQTQTMTIIKIEKSEEEETVIVKSDNNNNNININTDGIREIAIKKAQNQKIKIKEKQTRLDCTFCQRSFCKNFDLQQHMRCHTGEKPFQCIVCGRGFAQKSNVKKHMQAHKVWPEGPNHIVPQIQSSIRSRNNSACSSVGTNNDEYMQENESRVIMDNESEILKDGVSLSNNNSNNNRKNDVGDSFFVDSKYSCAYCSFNGRTYFELKSHLTVHKREKVFKCIVSSCGKIFAGSDLQSFLDHVKGHKNELIYSCHLCSRQFTSLNEFGQHQKIHNNTLTKKEPHALSNVNHPNDANIRHHGQPLAKAQQQFNIKNQQNNHFTQPQIHDQQISNRNIDHDAQNNGMQQQSQLRPSNEQKSNISPSKESQKYFRCSKCMNRYTTQAALDHHLSISSHHYPCTECDKVFPCERYLRRHLNTHTTNIHVCSFCDKQFKTAAYLKMHNVVHTGEKPFRCNLCEAAFNRRDKLNRHKLTHETVKKFKCPFKLRVGCTKEFNRPDKLKAHLLTHSGVRPHSCDSCPRTFSRLSRLREHKKSQHEDINNTTMDVNRANIEPSSETIICNNNINNKAIQATV